MVPERRLVNWLLQGSHGQRYCVLQNEFGTVPVDDALILRREQFADVAVVTMSTGCICCKVRGDLVEALKSLARGVLSESGHIDAVVIETSGLSEVGPVAQTFFADKFVQRNFRLDTVVTVVNAQTAPAALQLAQAGGAPDAIGADGDTDTDLDSDSESEAESDADGDEQRSGLRRSAGVLEDAIADAQLSGEAARLQCEQLCLADVVLLNQIDCVSEVRPSLAAGSSVAGRQRRRKPPMLL